MENDLTKLTSFQPLTPVSATSRFSFSKWLDGFTKRKLSQAPNLPSTKEQSTSKSERNASTGVEDKIEGATGERVRNIYVQSLILNLYLFVQYCFFNSIYSSQGKINPSPQLNFLFYLQ